MALLLTRSSGAQNADLKEQTIGVHFFLKPG